MSDNLDDRTPVGQPPATAADPPRAGSGPGRLLVAAYAILALAATGRSVMQIALSFDRAPIAYALSAGAAVIYLVATIAIARGSRTSIRVGYSALMISYVVPQAFPDKTVWSHFGSGYGYIPLVLPVLGLWWLRRVQADTSATG